MLTPPMMIVYWTVLGLFVGSFLNVCIHRLPLEGETVNKPRRSRCPKCKTTLTARENIPVLSWLIQRGKCRTCGVKISARYPLVEILNAVLWWYAISTAGAENYALWLVWSLVLSALFVATMVDFDCYEIPDEISIGGMIVAPILCLLVPALHADTALARAVAEGAEVDRVAAAIGGLGGMAVGFGVLYLIGKLGTWLYKTDAMGFGDVKLLGAGGGFIGAGGALVALMIAALAASVFGLFNIVRFLFLHRSRVVKRGRNASWGQSVKIARICGRYLPFGPFLALGIGIVLLHWEDVRVFLP